MHAAAGTLHGTLGRWDATAVARPLLGRLLSAMGRGGECDLIIVTDLVDGAQVRKPLPIGTAVMFFT
jgi:hypothetical protein